MDTFPPPLNLTLPCRLLSPLKRMSLHYDDDIRHCTGAVSVGIVGAGTGAINKFQTEILNTSFPRSAHVIWAAAVHSPSLQSAVYVVCRFQYSASPVPRPICNAS